MGGVRAPTPKAAPGGGKKSPKKGKAAGAKKGAMGALMEAMTSIEIDEEEKPYECDPGTKYAAHPNRNNMEKIFQQVCQKVNEAGGLGAIVKMIMKPDGNAPKGKTQGNAQPAQPGNAKGNSEGGKLNLPNAKDIKSISKNIAGSLTKNPIGKAILSKGIGIGLKFAVKIAGKVGAQMQQGQGQGQGKGKGADTFSLNITNGKAKFKTGCKDAAVLGIMFQFAKMAYPNMAMKMKAPQDMMQQAKSMVGNNARITLSEALPQRMKARATPDMAGPKPTREPKQEQHQSSSMTPRPGGR